MPENLKIPAKSKRTTKRWFFCYTSPGLVGFVQFATQLVLVGGFICAYTF